MRKTLFRQLIFYMLLFGLILSAVSWFVIEFFFDNYYYSQQKKLLATHTNELVQEYNDSGTAGIQPLIEEYYLDHGMSVHIVDSSTGNIYGTDLQGSGKQGMLSTIRNAQRDEVFISTTGSTNNPKEWLSYVIETGDGDMVMARISYTSINSVVSMVQGFFLYFGIALGVIFIIFAYIFSRSMSRPLKELNEIAKKMGQLDFSKKYEGGRIDEIGMLGKTLNEITDKLENTISQLQGELSKERTLEKMRTQFTAQVSHELQTPLSVIKGYSEALSDKIYSAEETSGVYDILLTETEKISKMVDDLLDLSQMESGVYVIRKVDFSPVQLISRIFNRHKNLPSDKNFDMQLDIQYPEDEMYSGDDVRLEQAVRNILVNAVKHVSDTGSVKLNLSKDAGETMITIFNSGHAIHEGDLQRIFDSYYQGKIHYGGTGLGLAISRHIVQLHGGSITAENTTDGVIFIIKLP